MILTFEVEVPVDIGMEGMENIALMTWWQFQSCGKNPQVNLVLNQSVVQGKVNNNYSW